MVRNANLNYPQMRRIQSIHFVGIGGSGMSGIAQVLLNQGYSITGSDLKLNSSIDHLKAGGAKIFIGHDQCQVTDADVVVKSSAVDFENVEIKQAFNLNIPVIRRAEMLAELMRFRQSIAVAGTHGKTTTTSLLAAIMAEDGRDPTFIIGGKVNSFGTGAKLGQGKYLIAEADESDASFIHLQPLVAVVTNIDLDHMETYEHDFERLKSTYLNFLHNLPFYGLAVVCADDVTIQKIIKKIGRPLVTYGFSDHSNFQIKDFKSSKHNSEFNLVCSSHDREILLSLKMPGRHNALNAAAAASVALEEGVSPRVIQRALKNFSGVSRRFEEVLNIENKRCKLTYIDDYGHHPNEIKATLEAARASWPDRKIILIFQPHRFSRTRDLFREFVSTLSTVDILVLLDVYPAGEAPLMGINSEKLSQEICNKSDCHSLYLADISLIEKVLPNLMSNNDLIISQGAGDISKYTEKLKSIIQGVLDE